MRLFILASSVVIALAGLPQTAPCQEAATAEAAPTAAPSAEPSAAAAPVAAPAAAAESDTKAVDPTGSWEWERTFGENTARMTLKLHWDGEKLTGEHESFGEKAAIKNGKYEAGKISFAVEREFNGNAFAVDFEGEPTETEIQGKVIADVGGSAREFDWTAKRYVDPADVVGVWKLEIDTPRGGVFEPTLTVRQENGELAGVYNSRFGDQDAKYVKIDDGKLEFEVSGEGPRGSFKSVYKGAVRGDKVEGTNEFQFGERSGEWAFKGQRMKPAKEAAVAADAESVEDNE